MYDYDDLNDKTIKTEISVFGRQALGAERRRSLSLAVKVLRYINVTRAAWTTMEFARIHSQLQGSSARASHFLDAETCEFPSLSMLPV